MLTWFLYTDEIPKRVFIHKGCNVISNKTSTSENISKDAMEMAKMCHGCGVNDAS